MRRKGIFLEARARLPQDARKSLKMETGALVLAMPRDDDESFRAASTIIATTLRGIENLPVLPREIEDILSISTTERRRWLRDGRLPSVGTRTVSLRGRASRITFHVFDPRVVEEVLDRDLVSEWREQDSIAKLETRRQAVRKMRLTRKPRPGKAHPASHESGRPNLSGWEEFERDGPLR